jgi:O-succinylbenzoic acid--CoA ligase
MNFVEEVERHQATLSALVPTQIFDLIERKIPSPSSLRAVVIGGGVMDKRLYERARALGWRVLPSYGMTECCSQVATASLESLEECLNFPALEPLAHVKIEVNSEQQIYVQSEALYSAYAWLDDCGIEWNYRNEEEGIWTSDQGTYSKEHGLVVFGRRGSIENISGELVSLQEINYQLQQSLRELNIEGEGVFLFVENPRLGHEVCLVLENSAFKIYHRLLQQLQQRLSPFERPKTLYFVEKMPIGTLGKIQLGQLRRNLRL